MITIHYIGAHKGERLTARMGDRVIRWAQRGYSLPARNITHTEALLAFWHGYGYVHVMGLYRARLQGRPVGLV